MAAGALLLLARRASAQTPDQLLDQDRIDLAGRTTLTLGSGARAFGMGGAFLARADDATAASWNPAGLSYLRLPEMSIAGTNTLYHKDRALVGGPESDRFDGSAVDFAAFTWPLRLRGASGTVQVNFQRVVPFGGSRKVVRSRSDSRESVTDTGEASGGFDVLAFGTGWRVTQTLRIGVTLNRWFDGYHQSLDRDVPDSIRRNRSFDATFDIHAWNSNIGVIWTPVEQVNLAAVFKTPFTADVRLDKTRTDSFFAGDSVTTNSHVSQDVRLKFPAALGFGVSWRPRSALTLSADFTRTYWSRARISNYFTLPFTPRPVPEPVPAPDPFFYDPLNYPLVDQSQGDTDQIRFGVEYVLIGGKIKVPLRAGYFNDQQIIRPGGGDQPRFNGFTAGLGIILGPMLLDVAYLHESGSFFEVIPATVDQPTAISVRNTLRTERFFASLIYRLGGSH